ncbi:hypothetical protein OROHE_026386 [Orobanche hederae]
MRNGQIALEEYVIVRTLTKAPEAYPDAKNQPHFQLTLRLKEKGYVIGCSAGDRVPYIICSEGIDSGSSSGIAQRARHPDELTKGNVTWMIDIDYYLAQQIHPVVSRLCASIEGTSPACLADCLGLDSFKFKSKSTEVVVNELGTSLLSGLDADESYRVIISISSSFNEKSTDMQDGVSISNFGYKLCCPQCPEENDSARRSPALIANQVKRQADGFISRYYNGMMTCEDETCKHTTRSLNMGVLGDSERGTVCPNYPCCNGRLVRQYTERDLYRQLSYFCYVFNSVPCTEKIKGNSKIAAEKEEARISLVVELAAKTVQKIKDTCSYGWEVPRLNVRIHLSASEILKLADHIIAKSKKIHDAVASIPLDKCRPKKFMFIKYEWKVLLAAFLLCLIEVFSASFSFYLIEVRGCYIFSAFLIHQQVEPSRILQHSRSRYVRRPPPARS